MKWIDVKRDNQTRFAPIILIPIDIEKNSARSGYKIKLRDDETQINISLIEMLRSEFDISITGFDPLPQDEAGVDTRMVFNTFTQKILDQPEWEVLEAAAIGLFSFSQFVMWNDIHNREDDLRKNRLVESMMEGHLTWTPQPIDENEEIDTSDLLMPVEADASQMLAVKEAIVGKSFVLHGPPGTGKSQTITAIIANALAQGKRVLFVAEKMAALSVVERRMQSMGLGSFCLEVHSTKATKNHVLEQIQEAVELEGARPPQGFAAKRDEVKALRARLDAYAKGLAAINSAGITLRDQIRKYLELSNDTKPLFMDFEFVQSISSPQEFARKMNSAERLITLSREMTSIEHHPLKFIKGADYSSTSVAVLPDIVSSFEKCAGSLRSAVDRLCELIGHDAPDNPEDMRSFVSQLAALSVQSYPPVSWDSLFDFSVFTTQIHSIAQNVASLSIMKAKLKETYGDDFFALNAKELKREWIEASGKGVFSRGRAINAVVAKLSFASLAPINKDNAEAVIKQLSAYQATRDDLIKKEAPFESYLSDFMGSGIDRDWQHIQSMVEIATSFNQAASHAGLDKNTMRLVVGEAGQQALAQARNAFAEYDVAQSALNQLLGQVDFTADDLDWLEGITSRCQIVLANKDLLREWMTWRHAVQVACDLGLDKLVAYLESHAVHEGTFKAFCCGVYKSMCMVSFDAIEGMNSFSGIQFDKMVSQYARAEQQLRSLSKDEIFYRVASRLPDLTQESASNSHAVQLAKALRSRGRNVSIRSLFHDMADMVLAFCPCVLMSPLSVAQYLEAGNELFDIVIFDEASQLQTCKAVGALSRAKSAVIVGDPKQMPPTSFFKGNVTGEEYDEVADLESVLEDCLALNLPQTYLKWHYRSRHESLIAFSNKRFYENKLYTFPSADDRNSHVHLAKVQGVFERGGKKVNLAEAEAIVAELKRRAHDLHLSKDSLGVITFNIPQQVLIEDLFQEACEQDAVLDEWSRKAEEPLFIKNLENVQGDERDVILFSITYAPDKNGFMSMNFGPLNREGGWRRLNVAVTRARSEMVVFSSIDASDIDANRVSSMGPVALRDFLEFARSGSFGAVSISELSQRTQRDQIAIAISSALNEQGYKTTLGVGRSLYRVDIGVVDPRYENRYVAGILLDGNGYSLAHSTRDREVSQIALLERLGWHVKRVWAVDWWENSQNVIDRLVEFLHEAEKDEVEFLEQVAIEVNMGEPNEINSDKAVSGEMQDNATAESVENVAEPDIGAASKESSPIVAETDLAASSTMAEPITQDGHSTVTSSATNKAVKEGSEEPAYCVPVRLVYEEAVLDLPQVGPDGIMDVDNAIIAEAMMKVVNIEAPVEKTILYRRVAQAFGIGRIGSRIQSKFDSAFKKVSATKVSQAKRTIVWRKNQDPKTYFCYRVPSSEETKRDSSALPLEEIAACCFDALQEHGELRQDELIKESSLLFGYKRVAASISEYFKKALNFGTRRGVVGSRENNL